MNFESIVILIALILQFIYQIYKKFSIDPDRKIDFEEKTSSIDDSYLENQNTSFKVDKNNQVNLSFSNETNQKKPIISDADKSNQPNKKIVNQVIHQKKKSSFLLDKNFGWKKVFLFSEILRNPKGFPKIDNKNIDLF